MDLFSQPKYQAKNISVLRLINDYEKQFDSVFIKVKSEWLPPIREFLREETGLRMHQKGKGTKILKDTNVSFYVVPDRESKFIQLIDENYPELDFDEYAAFKKLLFQLKNSKLYFEQNDINPKLPFNQLSTYLEVYFEKYNLDILLNTLFKNVGKSADIWGTYTYNGSKIEIYYVPIILFSQIQNISLEHAIITTLVHEMAHAYHHMGKDKDETTWVAMSSTNKRIVEGLAEYYTWLFVETYKSDFPSMKSTYDSMFKCLGNEYTIFKSWTPKYSKEVINSALRSTRKKSIKEYEDFVKQLEDVKMLMH